MVLQKIERRPAVFVERHDLAVHYRVRRQLRQSSQD
jgi:hypothetical protein